MRPSVNGNGKHDATAPKRRRGPLDVAIVGMACRFPGAGSASEFWTNLLDMRDQTGEVPADRWDPALFHDSESTANDRVYCRRGGYFDEPVEFDPAEHGVMPLVVAGAEPEQLLILDAARAALVDAGLPGGLPDGRRAHVVIGRGNYFNRGNLTRLQHGRIVAQTLGILRALHPEWSAEDLSAIRADLKAGLPPFEAATVPGQLTNATSGRVADRLDLRGANFVVDAASASSLVALDLGARAVRERRADIALVGGVYVAADVDFSQVFCLLGALSRTGVSRPFTASADGMLPGEGVGVVVLKRLADAERDGNRIYAVVKGVGVVSDGRGAGLAAPSARGHARAMRLAGREARIEAASVELVVGHGLGVPVSDRAELRALRAVYPVPDRGERALVAPGATIGHAMPAAGMAGLVTAALALHHRVLPPTPGADDPHPLLAGEDSPFRLQTRARPWIHGNTKTPRRAGVNAFGFAGVNAHVLLEEHSPSAEGMAPGQMSRWETEAILLGAQDRAGLVEVCRALGHWLECPGADSVSLGDLAFTLNTGQRDFPARLGLVVASISELRERLRASISRLQDSACRSLRDARGTYFWDEPVGRQGGLVLLYPGEGSQYPGMLADLCPRFPEARRVLDTADRVARMRGHERLPSELLYGRESDGLWAIESAVNVVLSAHWALHQVVTALGIRPNAVLGHSSGELLALAAAGVVRADQSFADELGALGSVFAELEQAGRVPAARLLAVAASREVVEPLAREAGAVLAIDNCPHQVVLSGSATTIDALALDLRQRGTLCEELPFGRAYHTDAFRDSMPPVAAFFAKLRLTSPSLPIYSCATASPMPADIASIRALAVEQWARPVAFRETVAAMHADGLRVFLEVGARGSLTGWVEDILRGRPHFAVAAQLPRRDGPTQINHLVASLYAQGVDLRPDYLYARRSPRRLDLSRDPASPRSRPALALGFPEMKLSRGTVERLRTQSQVRDGEKIVKEHASPHRLEGILGEAPSNGRQPDRREHSSGNGWTTARFEIPSQSTELPGEELLLEHFRTMDAFLDTQREVMEAYFSARGGTRPSEPPACVNGMPAPNRNGHSHATSPRLDPTPLQKARGAPSQDARLDDPRTVLLEQVSQRTGYPIEMLELDQDMEADLGIDSIKRVEILGELQQRGLVGEGTDLEHLSRCRTLGEVIAMLRGANARKQPDERATSTRWAGTIESLDPGREFVGTWPLDATTDPVAQHHTLGGRRLSELDPSRLGLPVVPFTVMAELLAQAAAILVPDRPVVALRQVLARRWVAYEAEATVLDVRAQRLADRPDEVWVTLLPRNASSRRGGKDVAFEGTVVFGDARPSAPSAEQLELESERPCRFLAAELYEDQWLFHGPPFQALTRVGRSTPRGIEGTLQVLPRRQLFPESHWPILHTDPIVIDAFTHLLGCWGIDEQAGPKGEVMFPLRVAELALFDVDPGVGESLDCRIHVRDLSRHRVRVDADLVTADGRSWVRIRGWEDWRFYWPRCYRDVFRDPKRVLVGDPLDVDADPAASAVWLEPPDDMARPVWGDVLAWVQLEPGERRALRGEVVDDDDHAQRVWERIAAKEAARRIWLDRGGPAVYPADLVVDLETEGRGWVRGESGTVLDGPIRVAWASRDGLAVALATGDPALRPGIAARRVDENTPDVETPGLEAILTEWQGTETIAPGEIAEWRARLASAFDALARSRSMSGESPSTLSLLAADRATGRVVCRVDSPGAPPARVACHTARRGEFAWAWTLGRTLS